MTSATTPTVLSAKGLRKQFRGVLAIDDVDIDVEAGRVLGIIGPNGSGKTTAFNLLTGFVARDAGSIEVDGVAHRRCSPRRMARAGLSRTFQQCKVFPKMSVEDHLSMSRRPDRRRQDADAWEALVEDLVGRLGRDHLLGDCSFGDRKRVEIAMAVAQRPLVLLLDEIAAGVDVSVVQLIERTVRQVAGLGAGVVLVEHDVPFVMGLSDEVLALDHGVVIARGTPEAVRADPQVQEAYLGRHR
ncbi:MAG: ABC transporter ATP-binding protein [Acidimicrobiia bacterium]